MKKYAAHVLLIAALATSIVAPQFAVAAPEGDLEIANFKENPLPAGWEVEGYAFGARETGPERQQLKHPTKNQRQYRYGTLTSPEFTIQRNGIVVHMYGVYNPVKCCAVLIVDGEKVRRAPRGKTVFDVREFKGEQARLQIRDEHFNGWLVPRRIYQTNDLPENAQKEIPVWEPKLFEATIDGPYLLLPVDDKDAPIQTVCVEIDGEKKLSTDLPLAMEKTDDVLAVYDLRGFQGKKLQVAYHATADSRTGEMIRQDEIPAIERGPAFHIHCRLGKLNDPNGLVYYEGKYHLFHQYYYGIRAKHWDHWVSTDLVHWKKRPIALFPDELGSMHSGSGAVDVFNTGGFHEGDEPTIIAAFTGSRGMGGKDKMQMQGIAYSTDGGRTFTKYAGNPVIGKKHMKSLRSDNSRDPRIFWYSPATGMDFDAEDGHWVMALFEDGGQTIFTSDNLKDWKKQSRVKGFHECPELFPLAVDGDPQNIRWIMYGADGAYHIGRFNGKTFEPETNKKIPFNRGRGYYAAQTFNNTPGAPPRRIQVGWQGGQISFPIELSLRTTPLGMRLCALPVEEIENLYTKQVDKDGLELRAGAPNPLANLKGGLYDIEIDADAADADALILKAGGKEIRYDVKSHKLDWPSVKLPAPDGRLHLRVLVDRHSIDIFAGKHGLFHIPMWMGLRSKDLGLHVEGGPVEFGRLRVRELKSIWD